MAARSPRSHRWLALCAGACSSCALVFDADRPQCAGDADCAGRGFRGARCDLGLCVPAGDVYSDLGSDVGGDVGGDDRTEIGTSRRPPAGAEAPDRPLEGGVSTDPMPPGSRARYLLRLEMPRRSELGPDEVELRLCGMEDADCSEPALAVAPPDPTGLLTLDLDPTFRGYLEVDAPGLAPTLAFLPLPSAPGVQAVVYRLLERLDLRLLTRQADLPLDDELGFAIALVHDRLGRRASGGTLSVTGDADGSSVPYYFAGGVATQAADSTDAQGAGGWSQLPIGKLVARAHHSATLEPIGAAQFRARPGHVSIVPLQPEPQP